MITCDREFESPSPTILLRFRLLAASHHPTLFYNIHLEVPVIAPHPKNSARIHIRECRYAVLQNKFISTYLSTLGTTLCLEMVRSISNQKFDNRQKSLYIRFFLVHSRNFKPMIYLEINNSVTSIGHQEPSHRSKRKK